MSGDLEDQANELLALGSIYDESVFSAANDSSGGIIRINIQLPDDFKIKLDAFAVVYAIRAGRKILNSEDGSCLDVHSLPPVILQFWYPHDYPSVSAPNYTLSCSWLSPSQMSCLCSHLDDLWTENLGLAVLFVWIQFLQDETLDFLEISSNFTFDLGFIHSYSRQNSRKSRNVSRQTSQEVHATEISENQPKGLLGPGAKVEETLSNQGCKKASSNDSSNDMNSAAVLEAAVASLIQGACAAPEIEKIHEKGSLNHLQNGYEDDVRSYVEGIDTRVLQETASVKDLIMAVIAHDNTEKEKTFNSSWFECQICFDEKSGMDCLSLDCDHVHCKECLTGYFQVQIEEGSVTALECPDNDCSACALPNQVRSLVSEKSFERYERLLLKVSLDTMGDVVNCPKTGCGSPVVAEADGQLAICPLCRFPFCPKCLKQYHGVADCYVGKLPNSDDADDSDVEEEEWVFDGNMYRLKSDHESFQWIKKSTKSCPHCKAPIQKNGGCNVMTCKKCNDKFCWLCLHPLRYPDLYKHFRQENVPCEMYSAADYEQDMDDDY